MSDSRPVVSLNGVPRSGRATPDPENAKRVLVVWDTDPDAKPCPYPAHSIRFGDGPAPVPAKPKRGQPIPSPAPIAPSGAALAPKSPASTPSKPVAPEGDRLALAEGRIERLELVVGALADALANAAAIACEVRAGLSGSALAPVAIADRIGAQLPTPPRSRNGRNGKPAAPPEPGLSWINQVKPLGVSAGGEDPTPEPSKPAAPTPPAPRKASRRRAPGKAKADKQADLAADLAAEFNALPIR